MMISDDDLMTAESWGGRHFGVHSPSTLAGGMSSSRSDQYRTTSGDSNGESGEREIGTMAHSLRQRISTKSEAAKEISESVQQKPPGQMRGVARNESVYVTLPEGIKAGQVIKTQAPDGHIFQFSVPPGVKGGDMVQVEVPRPQRQTWRSAIQVKVPKGCRAGDEMMARGPDGSPFTCVIPPGYGPGDILSFDLNDAAASEPKVPEQPLSQNSMNSSGQYVVKVPIEARPGQVVYDRSPFGDIFSYYVPEHAEPDQLTTVWPIGADRTTNNLEPQEAMSARTTSGKAGGESKSRRGHNPLDDVLVPDSDGTVPLDMLFWKESRSPSGSGLSLASGDRNEKGSNDSFHTAHSQQSQVSSEAPLPPKRRDKPSKSETVFVTSHHMRSAAAATTTGARAMVMSSSPLPLDPGAGAGAAGGRRSSLVSRAVEPQSAPAGAASVPPPDYSSDEDDGDAAAPEEEARNPLRW